MIRSLGPLEVSVVILICIGATICILICVLLGLYLANSRFRDFAFGLVMYLYQTADIPCVKRSTLVEISEELFRDLHGDVLELGPGNGDLFAILRHNTDIETWIGVEPGRMSAALLQRRIQNYDNPPLPFQTRVISDPVETDPLGRIEAQSVDFVVLRHVLCSISSDDDPNADDGNRSRGMIAHSTPGHIFGHLLRVLRPGGEVRFIEHVQNRDRGCIRCCCQTLLSCIWRYLCGNCHIDRSLTEVLHDFIRETDRMLEEEEEDHDDVDSDHHHHSSRRAVLPDGDGIRQELREYSWHLDTEYRVLPLGCHSINPHLIGSLRKVRRGGGVDGGVDDDFVDSIVIERRV